ncbi:hypothetical protein RJ639_016217 [Escallonia herrerae]|uniref:Retrotransposon gag domain-containing protein n=1 Tax=Escallonia herrerae TaxID=1293975 RepID=A0AA89ALL2_9ASTE|nr:hypothetical protein RJ639_016217 [Escallonia herrerae]
MSHAIEKLTKTVEEKDFQIANLMNKLKSKKSEKPKSGDVGDADKALKQDDSDEHPDACTFGGHENKENKSISIASLSVQQLQDMIASSIKAQYGGPSRKALMQHVTHFIETYNDAGTEGDFLMKQFIQSLKGNAFDWYTDLEPESTDCWEEMESEFQNRFYSTRRSVSMMELINTKQGKEEPVVYYINKWRALSLDCKERLSEASAVEMCMQDVEFSLLHCDTFMGSNNYVVKSFLLTVNIFHYKTLHDLCHI